MALTQKERSDAMEFAGYTFEINEYNGDFYSLLPAHTRLRNEHGECLFSDVNQCVYNTPADTNESRWSKAILLMVINYPLILSKSTYIHENDIHYYWWIQAFNAIFEYTISSEPIMSGSIPVKPSTIIEKVLIWSNKLYKHYHHHHMFTPNEKYKSNQQYQLVVEPNTPHEINNRIDENCYYDTDHTELNSSELFAEVYEVVKRRTPSRNASMYWDYYHNECMFTEIANEHGLTSNRIQQVVKKINKRLYETKGVKHLRQDTICSDTTEIHDEKQILWPTK